MAGPGSGIAGAAIVSNPLCLHSAAASLSRPWTLPYLYNLGLAIRLRQYTREHKAALSPRLQVSPCARTQTMTYLASIEMACPHQHYIDYRCYNLLPQEKTAKCYCVLRG